MSAGRENIELLAGRLSLEPTLRDLEDAVNLLFALAAQIEELEAVLRGISHANDAVPPGTFKADPDKLLEWCCRQARAALAQSDPPEDSE